MPPQPDSDFTRQPRSSLVAVKEREERDLAAVKRPKKELAHAI